MMKFPITLVSLLGSTVLSGVAVGMPPVTARTIKAPEDVVRDLLIAVREGNQQLANDCLTRRASSELEKSDMHIVPPGSPQATFEIKAVRRVPKSKGVQVVTVWKDKTDDGSTEYEITWILRAESGRWGISGMATTLFTGKPPLVLNFENPTEMRSALEAALRQESLLERKQMER